MKTFRYAAFDAAGKACRGVAEAETPEHLRKTLRAQGLLPTTIKPAGLFPARLKRPKHQSRLRASDMAVFTRQMATLLSSGVQIEAALTAVASQSVPRTVAPSP